jgi:hypothetical protein
MRIVYLGHRTDADSLVVIFEFNGFTYEYAAGLMTMLALIIWFRIRSTAIIHVSPTWQDQGRKATYPVLISVYVDDQMNSKQMNQSRQLIAEKPREDQS